MTFISDWNEAAITTLGLFWTAFWAFAVGYCISSLIQVFVTRERMQKLMGTSGIRSVILGTFFGFISSSCSFAALAGTRSLFTKGADIVPALAYLLSSTNLVIELGIIIAVFLNWQFVVGEYVGGVLLIIFMWILVALTKQWANVEEARDHARKMEEEGQTGGCCHDHGGGGGGNEHNEHQHHQHHHPQKDNDHDEEAGKMEHGEDEPTHNEIDSDKDHDHPSEDNEESKHENQKSQKHTNWWKPLTSLDKWKQVAMTYCMEWGMVWKDVTVGFTVAGVIAVFVPRVFFESLFVGSGGDPSDLNFGEVLEQTIVGPVAAFFTFIGSMGNIPLAAVLYGNGVSFAGIMAFIFSDLIVIPILRVNAKFYGWRMALYIMAVFLICLVATSLVLHYVFDAIGILPSARVEEVSKRDFFDLDYTFGLNVAFIVLTIVCNVLRFKQSGFKISMGSSTTEVVLFWLAILSYTWLIGGLIAGAFDD